MTVSGQSRFLKASTCFAFLLPMIGPFTPEKAIQRTAAFPTPTQHVPTPRRWHLGSDKHFMSLQLGARTWRKQLQLGKALYRTLGSRQWRNGSITKITLDRITSETQMQGQKEKAICRQNSIIKDTGSYARGCPNIIVVPRLRK